VPPSATVAKSLVGLACADVNYHVKVTNTDTADNSITLQSLTDDKFGDLTQTGSNGMLSTTCGVATNATPAGPGTLPATIAKGGVYECDFTAHFCGGSHTNTATANVRDVDHPDTDVPQSSDALTVKVTATVGP